MEIDQRSNNYHFEVQPLPKNEFITRLDQSIRKIIKSEGYINYEIHKQCVSTNGGNYLSTIYEIDVKGSTKNGYKETNIFVKHAIDLGSFQIISVSDAFNVEVFAYSKLSKIFATLQENANVPIEERFKMIKAYDESNSEAIIMENFAKKGYTTYYRMDVVPLQFMKRCVEHLARFHALSFVLKEKQPDYFDKKLRHIKHLVKCNDDLEEFVNKTKDTILDLIDGELKVKAENVYKGIVKKYAEFCNDESIKACLCHGDYRPNNILVKIDEAEVQDIMPVDYQLIHYGSPVFDFLYLIYSSTDRDFRKAHMSDLKDLYYETLTNFLKYFELNAEIVYPKKDFEEIYKEKHEYGPMYGVLGIPFLFAREKHVVDMSKEKSDLSLQLDERFKDRLRDLMEDYDEWVYV